MGLDLKRKEMEPTLSLTSIPTTAFGLHMCSYLGPKDLLALRLTCKQIHSMMHDDQDSNMIWHSALRRNFSIESTAWKEVINVKSKADTEANSTGVTLFGYDPGEKDFLIRLESPFHVWRYWLKICLRLFNTVEKELPLDSPLITGPFFLRAAKFWQTVFQWCDDTTVSGEVGLRVRASFLPACDGIPYLMDLYDPKRNPGLMAILAIYSFTSGQSTRTISTAFDGLFGGYHAYGYYSSMGLCSVADQMSEIMFEVASDFLGQEQGISKRVYVYNATGATTLQTESSYLNQPVLIQNHSKDKRDEILIWMEEFAQRLDTGFYRPDLVGNNPVSIRAITLFPQFPRDSDPIMTSPDQPEIVSRAVTRGVEVIASAVYVPQAQRRYGFIYCIRLRLLTADEPGYLSESERGFKTCQLFTRQWWFSDSSSGQTNFVEGQGVIGLYPILLDGGFSVMGSTTSDDFVPGTFQYQSCTGSMNSGSFRGKLGFVPGTIQAPTGPAFDVALNPVTLEQTPTFLY
eukprot:Nitzschia sp. Nitz4//scaffold70_size99833//57737//59408//NITZ4_004598-RA/size99833-snap-gene-0.147-mRNA-1//-1//CDS//3329557144//3078//frame0